MKEKTFLHLHRNDVSMTMGGGSNGHPLSIHSASIGTSWKARGWRYIASILMFLALSIGNVWAIDWAAYGSKPVAGGQYYLRSTDSNGQGWFFNTPSNKHTSGTNVHINETDNSDAILFTVGNKIDNESPTYEFDKPANCTTFDGISFQSGGKTYYLWAFTKTSETWLNRTQKVITKVNFAQHDTYYQNSDNNAVYYLRGGGHPVGYTPYKDSVLYALPAKVSGASSNNAAKLQMTLSTPTAKQGTGTNNALKNPWIFISPEAYEDATAGTTGYTGAQYYYTVEAQVYTNGAASSTGGIMKMAPRTYKKPAVADWTYPDDYVDEIDTKVKGGYGDYAVVNIYCKVSPNSGYNFIGFKDASNTALEESSEKGTYTYLPNTYELVDAVGGIYRVSLRVNGTDADHPTEYKLRACFAQAAEPVAYEYNANNEKIAEYTNLSAAFTDAAEGSRIELQKEISNVSSALTIAKNLTLDFKSHTITGTADIMIQITDGNVTFVDNSTSVVGGITTGGAKAISVSGGSLTINDGIYQAATCAVESTGGSVTIKNGGYKTNALLSQPDISGTMTIHGGFYTHKNGLDALETGYAAVKDIPTGMKYSASEYNYMVVSKTSSNYPLCVVVSEKENEPTITKNFNTIEKALTYVNSEQDFERVLTLYLRENASLSAGNYTIPTHATLVIPYSEEQAITKEAIASDETPDPDDGAYCTLTLQNGAHIDVMGTIEVGGVMTGGGSAAQGEHGIARPGGPQYGWMKMESGSSITLTEGANLNAYGYVTGSGTVDVRRGATVREMFQINDWKGYSATTAMARGGSVDYTYKVLPVNQYFIQNVEVPTTYRPGSRLLGQVAVKLEIMDAPVNFTDVGVIGVKYSDEEKAANSLLKDDVAVFLLDNEDTSEDTWVRKSYDATNDIQLYEVNNSAHLGSLVMTIDMTHIYSTLYIDADSREFVLPITNNFKIHLLYGNLYVTQDTELLPGAEIEINKKGTMTINQVWDKTYQVWRPQTLYLYDKDQWGTYVYKNKDGDDYNFGYATRVRYRPGGVPTVRTLTPDGLGDAKLTVHGTVDVKGYLKTTQGDWSAVPVRTIIGTNTKKYATTCTATELEQKTVGGASITSTIADAGTIIFSRAPGSVGTTGVRNYIWQVNSVGDYINDEPDYYGDHVEPALLKNANGTFTQTENTLAGNSFCYIDFKGVGTWKALQNDGCFVYEVVNDETIYYAKPKDYVALANGKTENADHTYTSATGDRTFILMDDCQWWEVEPVAERPDLFHCTHPQNDMYYYWDGSKWTEKRYTVTWKDWDGTTWATYSLKYGVQPKFLGNVPGREKDDYYTYDFVGWSPEITNSTIVTGDVTYTAQYDRKDVMYTITWLDEGNKIIEVGYFKLGEIPTCTEAPDMTNKEWTPAVAAVTGDATYKLDTKDNDGPYDIKFVNWNGEQIGATQSVAKDKMPTTPATNPTKPAAGVDLDEDGILDVIDMEYEFAGWTPTVVAATADAVYTATFQEKPITYTITWKNSDGSVLETDENVGLNVVPQYNGATPVRPEDGENYTFAGWETTVVAATEDAEYVAKYIAKDKVVDGETYTVPASTHVPVTTITIKDDGKVSIPSGSLITATTLILESSGSMSGELIATNDRIHATNAYYDLNLNIDGRHWFAFGVPWVVNLDVTPLTEVESGRTLVLGRDYEIVYYNGATRATQGAGAHCWEKVADGTHILQPGKGYMIAFAGHINTVRFAKATGTPVIFNGTVKLQNEYGDGDDNGWNGLANPMAFHAKFEGMNAPTTGYVHDGGEIGHDGYTECSLENKRMIVGKMVYVQVASNADVTPVQATTGEFVAAPARRTNTGKATDKQYLSLNDYYQVSIADANEQGGSVYVLPEENKEDKYVIGHDLSHLGISDQKAQIWVFRYGTKLALNTTAPIDDVAEYALRVYAPKNGEYTITNNQSPVSDDEYVVYLTRNGEAIWNLSDGAYTTDLTSGVHKEYGLRLSARKTPAVVTGIDEAIVDANGETRKVLINNQVFIIRGNEVYTIDGQMVK